MTHFLFLQPDKLSVCVLVERFVVRKLYTLPQLLLA